MGINLPDLLPFGFKQINTGLTYDDDLADLLPDALNKVNHNSRAVKEHLREKLTANRTYYIAPSGSDLNDGKTSSNSFLTIAKAVAVVYNQLDLNGFAVTLSLGDGAYTETLLFDGLPVGAWGSDYPITLQGNASNPALVFLQTPGLVDGEACLQLDSSARVAVKNLRIGAASSLNASLRYGIATLGGSRVLLEGIEFSTMPVNGVGLFCEESIAYFAGSLKITGGARSFVQLLKNSFVGIREGVASVAVAVSNSPQFVYFLDAQGGSAFHWDQGSQALSFSGAASGKKYYLDALSTAKVAAYPTGLLDGDDAAFAIAGDLTAHGAVDLKTSAIVRSTLQAYGASTLYSTLNVGEDVTLSKKLTVGGAATFLDDLTVEGNADFADLNAENITASSAAFSTLSVTGASTLASLTVTNATTFNGTVLFNNDVFVDGEFNLPAGSVKKANLSATGGLDKDILESFGGELRWSNRLSTVEDFLPSLAPKDSPEFIGVPTVPTAPLETDSDQIASTAYVKGVVRDLKLNLEETIAARLPIGTIVIWHSDVSTIPDGFQICNGENGTPDLRDKFVFGAGQQEGHDHCVGEIGGTQVVTVPQQSYLTTPTSVKPGGMYAVGHALTLEQMPPHRHADQPFLLYNGGNEYAINFPEGDGGKKSDDDGGNTYYVSRVLNSPAGSGAVHGHAIAGSSEDHDHRVVIPPIQVDVMPPYSVRAFMMRVL